MFCALFTGCRQARSNGHRYKYTAYIELFIGLFAGVYASAFLSCASITSMLSKHDTFRRGMKHRCDNHQEARLRETRDKE